MSTMGSEKGYLNPFQFLKELSAISGVVGVLISASGFTVLSAHNFVLGIGISNIIQYPVIEYLFVGVKFWMEFITHYSLTVIIFLSILISLWGKIKFKIIESTKRKNLALIPQLIFLFGLLIFISVPMYRPISYTYHNYIFRDDTIYPFYESYIFLGIVFLVFALFCVELNHEVSKCIKNTKAYRRRISSQSNLLNNFYIFSLIFFSLVYLIISQMEYGQLYYSRFYPTVIKIVYLKNPEDQKSDKTLGIGDFGTRINLHNLHKGKMQTHGCQYLYLMSQTDKEISLFCQAVIPNLNEFLVLKKDNIAAIIYGQTQKLPQRH